MKILILANNDIGLYNFRAELIERLIEEKNEVYISLPKGNKVAKLTDLGCEFIETNVDRRGANIWTDLKLFLKYKKILSQIKPDVVLTYTIKPNIYGGIACRLKKIKCIANITGLGTVIEKNILFNKFIIKLYRIALKKNKCVFCQNQGIKDYLIENKIKTNRAILKIKLTV